MTRRLAALLAGLAVLVGASALAAGCHRQPDRLDMGRASRRIGESLHQRFRLPIGAVECPKKVGAEFTCSTSVSGLPLTVTVTQRSASGDLRVVPDSAVLVMADVRADLRKTLAAQFDKQGLRAGCGSAKIRVVPPGGSFECKVTDGKSSRNVTVRVRDSSGNRTYALH